MDVKLEHSKCYKNPMQSHKHGTLYNRHGEERLEVAYVGEKYDKGS